MISGTYTAALTGLNAYLVKVEIDITDGLPKFAVVGLPTAAVRESGERVRSAITNAGFRFPAKRITVNLSPASGRKDGTHFDLPIAVGMIVSAGYLKASSTEGIGFIGELTLDGQIRGVHGALPLVMGMRDAGIKKAVVPEANAEEAGIVRGIEILPAKSLKDVVAYLKGTKEIEPFTGSISVENAGYSFDFSDVRGQENAKRAIVIATAGRHGLYMTGSPGTGKTMLASRIPTIMPELSYEEILELTKIYSIAGLLSTEVPVISTRPFRMPYHGATAPALIGGGMIPKPGEVSLAHNGVLFLDEFPEFDRKVIELLRQPLETGKVAIERMSEKAIFPAGFILVAAGNPCKCGYYGDTKRECRCTGSELHSYQRKLSGPIIDRIDIQIKVERSTSGELSSGAAPGTSSADMKRLVAKAIEAQKERGIRNADLSGKKLRKICPLSRSCEEMLAAAYDSMGLSARGYDKVVKVARTIADIEGEENILDYHIAEALSYRVLDRMYIR